MTAAEIYYLADADLRAIADDVTGQHTVRAARLIAVLKQ